MTISLFSIGAIISIMTNLLEELKGWKLEGVASVTKLITQVVAVKRNSDVSEAKIHWLKKVSAILFSICSLFFTIIFLKLPGNDPKLVKVSITTILFWLLGVILPILEILETETSYYLQEDLSLVLS